MSDRAAVLLLSSALHYLDAGTSESEVRRIILGDWRHLGAPPAAFAEASALASSSPDAAAKVAASLFDELHRDVT